MAWRISSHSVATATPRAPLTGPFRLPGAQERSRRSWSPPQLLSQNALIRFCGAALWTATAVLVGGCGGETSTEPPGSASTGGPNFETVYPMHQDQPDWSTSGLIAYRDEGITHMDSVTGAYVTDSTISGIWTVNPGNGERRRLLPFGYSPAWSRAGEWLTFIHRGAVHIVDANGNGLRRLTPYGTSQSPAWHPDGSTLVYDSNLTSSLYSIWRINSDGTDSAPLCEATNGQRAASWATGGSGVAMLWTGGAGYYVQVYSLKTPACQSIPLTAMKATHMSRPSYSPDGSKILFAAKLETESTPEVWIMNSDGSDLVRATVGGGWNPAWAGDGHRIVFVRPTNGSFQRTTGVLWVLDLKTGMTTQLTSWNS